MARKRIRIDVEDADGARYDIKVEGNVTREKVLKIFEMMNIVDVEDERQEAAPKSVGSKIWHVIDRQFPVGRFTSSQILEKYEDEYNEPIKHSVISTYLSRFAARSRLERARAGREWSYQILRPVPQAR